MSKCKNCQNMRCKTFKKLNQNMEFYPKIKRTLKKVGKVALCWCRYNFLKKSYYFAGNYKGDKYIVNRGLDYIHKPKECKYFDKPMEFEDAA